VPQSGSILILGGTGFLGSYFIRVLGSKVKVHGSVDRGEIFSQEVHYLDFATAQEDTILDFIKSLNCELIINCSALVSIEKCESNPNLAYWINGELPRIIGSAAKSINAKFVQISTDSVFDGTKSLRNESEPTTPISIYSKSKVLGEENVLSQSGNGLIVRVNFFGRSDRHSLFNFFYDRLRIGEESMGFTDIFFSPMYALDTVRAILQLVDLKQSGIFHLVGNERISKFDFGRLIARNFGFSEELIRPTAAYGAGISRFRSKDLSLANDKARSFGINFPSVDEGLTNLRNEF